MKPKRRVGIIGLGAIGVVYGKMLQEVEELEVKILVDEERKKKYEQEKFFLNDKELDFSYLTPSQVQEPLDFLFICVKYGQLNEAIHLMKNFVGEQTTILSLLNGITSEEEIAQVYGMNKVLYSICNGIDATRKGNHIFCSNPGIISFGESKNRELTDRVLDLKDCLEKAKIPIEIPEDMERTLWYKFMINVGMNQVSAVTGATYLAFQREEQEKAYAEKAMNEVIQIAKARNINLSIQDRENFFNHVLSKVSGSGKTSMLQDVEAGRPTEVAMFSEKVIQFGKELNIQTPINEELYNKIKKIEQYHVRNAENFNKV